ncbi:KAD9 kinase, partial [Tricholaema leucomelas]|nr:KAD9 kinase [Tricholaema leucomelas]
EKIEQVRKDAVEKAITAVKDRLELEKQATESVEEALTADHPEIQAMVEEAIRSASVSEVTLSPERYAEVLERALAELMKKNKDRFPGAPEKGGWVVDNYPLSADHWSALLEKRLLPDTVVCLKNTERDGACILARTYSANRDEINAKILKRLTDEALKKKEEIRKEMQEMQTSEEDQSLEASEEKGEKLVLPEFAEDDFPNLPEMETIKRKLDLFMRDWQTVESEIKQSPLVQVVVLEIVEQTPESLLNQIVLLMEKPFKYHGWELSAEDLEEEEEDLAAEGEDEEVEEEEE